MRTCHGALMKRVPVSRGVKFTFNSVGFLSKPGGGLTLRPLTPAAVSAKRNTGKRTRRHCRWIKAKA